MKTRIILLLLAAITLGCSKDYESPFAGGDNYIASFRLEKDGVVLNAAISKGDVVLTAPESLSLDGAVATIALSENAVIKPDPSTINDWAAEHTFTVSSFNGATNTYKYRVERRAVTAEGDVVLLSQADVEALAALKLTRIDGSLTVGAATGEDSVRSLLPLAGLKTVTRALTINATFAAEDLAGLESLETVGALRIVGTRKLLAASLPKLTTIPTDLNVEQAVALRSLDFPELVETGKNLRIYYNDSLRSLSFPKLRNVAGNFSVDGRYGAKASPETIALPTLETVGGSIMLITQPLLKEIVFPQLKSLSALATNNAASINMTTLPRLERVAIPLLESSQTVNFNNVAALKTLDLRSLQTLKGSLTLPAGSLESLELNKLQTVAGSLNCDGMNVLTRVSLPELAEVTGSVIISGTNMTEINCPKLAAAGTIYLIGAALTVAEFPKLKTITASLNVQSPALTTLDGLSALEEVPSISISGARALTSIAGLHALKSAGTMSFYNAESLTEMDLRGISLDRLSISGTTWKNLRRIAANDEFAGRLDFSVQNVAALPAIEGFRRVGRLTMSAYGVAALDLPLLEKVEEELSFSSSDGVLKTINLPNLKSAGSLIIVATETLNVPKLETVGGGVSISLMPDIAVLEFPKLKSIVGQLYINNSNNTQDRPLHSISFPVLESIGAKLTFNNSYAAAAFPNFTNLDGFAALRSVQGVTITRFANLVDFTGLKNAIPSFTRYDWNVTNCGYNPTYQDMLE